jgi:IclR family mhp operon transcriptional activator
MMMSNRDVNTVYGEVRALDRGLRLIEALADAGWCSPAALAATTGLDRATIYRLLSTLVGSGYAMRRPDDGHFALTVKIRTIGSAVEDRDQLIGIADAALRGLVEKIHWPSDLGVLTPTGLRITASSHGLSSMTVFRALVGKTRPILHTALGRAILAALHDDEREQMIRALISCEGAGIDGLEDRAAVARVVAETRARGHAQAVSTFQPNISAIALPVLVGARVAGSVNIVFFRSAMSIDDAAAMYLPALQATVAQIGTAMVAAPLASSGPGT